MRSLVLTLCLLSATLLNARRELTPAYVDSLTYQYFLQEDWNRLVETARQGVSQGIDFKYLQQRLGYAYYQKKDFYASMRHYEKALRFDPTDQGSLTYLYFAGLESGNPAFARYYAGKLSAENKLNFKQHALRPVCGADVEYARQWNAQTNRSDPDFVRMGLSTDLGYSFSLYQTISRFRQQADYSDAWNQYRSGIVQNEYYLLLSKQFNANLGLDLGYHSLHTKFKTDIYDLTLQEVTETLDTLSYRGNLWFGGLRYKWNRLHLGLSTSYLDLEYNRVRQTGLTLGYALPGRLHPFLNNALYRLQDDDAAWWVSKHSLGLMPLRNIWIEGYRTFGSLDNFVDLNGMYVFNSFDPTLSRTGCSVFWYTNPHFTVFGNYTLEMKQNSYLLNEYQQHALSVGILWKL